MKPVLNAVMLAGLLAGPGLVRADSLLIGQRQWTHVKIQRVDDGKLRFTAADGSQQAVRLETVARLQVDVRDDLNRAEQLRSEGKAAEALPAYEAALRTESSSHLGGFLRYRLMDLYGRTGQLDRAAEMFLDLVRQPDFYTVVKDWRPQEAVPARPKVREAALTLLEDGLRQIRTGLASESIIQLRDFIRTIPAAAPGAAPATPAQAGAGPSPSAPQPPGAHPGEAASVRNDAPEPACAADSPPASAALQALRARQYSRALQLANQSLGQPDLPRDLLADALHVRGVALSNLAGDRGQWLQAGWALARLIVEFPGDPRVPECQYYLGLVHQKLDQPAQARQLLQQVRQNPTATQDLRERAQRAMLGMGSDAG